MGYMARQNTSLCRPFYPPLNFKKKKKKRETPTEGVTINSTVNLRLP